MFDSIRDLILPTFIIIALVVGGTYFYSSLFSNYGTTAQNADDQTNTTAAFSKLNETTNTISANLRASSSTGDNPYLVLFTGAFESVKQLFNFLDVFALLVSSVGSFLTSIPGMGLFWPIVLGLIGTLITLLIAKIILGREL